MPDTAAGRPVRGRRLGRPGAGAPERRAPLPVRVGSDVLQGFKEFVLRGNVIDLAVAVVIGTAFTQVVTAISTDLIGGLLGVVGGTPDFGDAGFDVGAGRIVVGTTLTALVNFLIVAAVVYFVVVLPINRLAAVRRASPEPEPPQEVSEDVLLLREIRDALRDAGQAGAPRG